jgi:hypothetical protein
MGLVSARRSGVVLVTLLLAGAVLWQVEGAEPAHARTADVHPVSTTKPTAKGLGIRLLDYPDSQKNDPLAHEYIVQTSLPGTTLTRHVFIINTTGITQSVRIYASGASIKHGVFDISETSQNPLATWITPSTNLLHLTNGSHAVITVRIAIPNNAARGEQYAVLWAEMRTPTTDGSGTVNVVNRVGIRTYINVNAPKSASPLFRIDSVHASRSASGPTLLARIVNTGQVPISPTGTLQLTSGPANTNAGPFTASASPIISPGQTGTIRFSLPTALQTGPWTARVTATYGTVTHTIARTIAFPKVVALPSSKAFMLTEFYFALLLVALVLAVLVMLFRRRNLDN